MANQSPLPHNPALERYGRSNLLRNAMHQPSTPPTMPRPNYPKIHILATNKIQVHQMILIALTICLNPIPTNPCIYIEPNPTQPDIQILAMEVNGNES